jgi:hypothetical protein
VKLVRLCFVMFLTLSGASAAFLDDFSSPYPRIEQNFSSEKPKISPQVKKLGSAIIWHAPPLENQISNPELLKSESIDELALSYLLDGCREQNPEFVKIEKKFKNQNNTLQQISKLLIQKTTSQNLLPWQDTSTATNQYQQTLRYIKNNFSEFKKIYEPTETHNQKTIDSSMLAKANLEELCGTNAVNRVISIYKDL